MLSSLNKEYWRDMQVEDTLQRFRLLKIHSNFSLSLSVVPSILEKEILKLYVL